MARWHRSSDGPAPYGPSPEPPRSPTQPEAAAAARPDDPPDTDPGGATLTPSSPEPALPAYPSFVTPTVPGPPPPPPVPGGQSPLGEGPLPIAPWAPPPGAYSSTVPGTVGLQYGRTLDRVMAYLLDGFIVGIPVVILSVLLGAGAALGGMREGGLALVAGIVGLGIHLLYFVAFWTGGARATVGMQLMKLQIGDARTGETLTVQQGLVRWLALGGLFQFIGLVPPLTALSGLLAFLWELTLLATTASSPTKQGLHDRMANTALVQPTGAQTPAVTCLVVVVALFALWVVALVLVLLSGDMSRILSEVGASI